MQHAMNARVKICISRPKGVKCGRCHPFYSGTSCLTIKCGVPQGSVFGLLLFLIYMNDIDKCSQLLPFILFDDTNLFLSHQDISALYDIINQELKNIATWLSANKLSLNVNKTHFMIFKTRNKKISQNMSIMMSGDKIEQVKVYMI